MTQQIELSDRGRGEHDGAFRIYSAGPGRWSAAGMSTRAAESLVALGEMTGGIAHDFRNLLAVIESGLRLVERNLEKPEEARVYMAAAREGISRGAQLTAQLLAFAKQQNLEPHLGDVNELLGSLELFLNYGVGPDVRITTELTSGIPKCFLDPAQFNAAVLNLVVNARDAMPNGGEVQISTGLCIVETAAPHLPVPGAYVRVRVRDNGEGMSVDVAQKIFDPFFTTKGERGAGLGLPHVCAFMRLIGGYISVSSRRGLGTVIDLLFPTEAGTLAAIPSLRA